MMEDVKNVTKKILIKRKNVILSLKVRLSNTTLHLTAIPLRSIVARELGRYIGSQQ